MARPVPPSASTAKTLILVGLIFDIIFAVIFFVTGVAALAVSVAYSSYAAGFGAIWFVFGVISLLVIYLVYKFTYVRVKDGDYQGARTPTLVWAILSLVTLSIIPGILYLIGYIKLGDAIGELQQPPYAQSYAAPYGQPMAGQPMYPPPTTPAGAMLPPAGAPPLCPRCGQPATYVAQYGRWFCPRDQTYL